MSNRLIDLLLQMAPRERVLLGVLVALVLPLGLGFGVLLPLSEDRRAAESALAEARALDTWVIDRRAELSGLARSAAQAAPSEAIGASALEQSLIDRKLRARLSSLETRDGGEIALSFDEVPFTDLMRWLDAGDPGWGYDIAELRLRAFDRPAFVSAQVTLVPANPS